MDELLSKWEKLEAHKANVSARLKNYDTCLFRMAYKHSWYKLKGRAVTLSVVPVVGSAQEPDNNQEPDEPSNESKSTEVFWHFDGLSNNSSQWHTEPCDELQKIIQANQVHVPDVAKFYFHHETWIKMMHIHTHPDFTNWIYFYQEFNDDIDRWMRFRPVYESLAKAARNIAEFLVAHPDVHLPVFKEYETHCNSDSD